jgi:hypothetical protein
MKNGGVAEIPNPAARLAEQMRIMQEEQRKKDEEQKEKDEIIAREREETRKKFDELQAAFAQKIAELEEKLSKQQPAAVNNGTIINTGPVNINTGPVVVFNYYGAPNFDYLLKYPEDTINQVNKYGIRLPENLVNPIYFNKNHPENISVHCINESTGEFYVYGREGWEYADAATVMEKVRLVSYQCAQKMIAAHCTREDHLTYGRRLKNYESVHDADTQRELRDMRSVIVSHQITSKKLLTSLGQAVGNQIILPKK